MKRNFLKKSETLWRGITILKDAALRLFKEKYTYRASALAFTTLLTMVPLVSVILSLIAHFPFFNRLTDLARGYIFANFLPTSSNIIQHYFEGFVTQASRLPTLGIAFLFVTVMTLIVTVEHTLNDVWHVPKRKKKYAAFFLYWIILIIAPLLIGFSVLISSYLFSLSWFKATAIHLDLSIPLLKSLPLLINTLIFTTLYVAVPNATVKMRHGLIGGLLAAILFEIAKKGFVLYMRLFPNYEVIYGTLATIPIFLIWIYISWLIILYGALVTEGLSKIGNSAK